jgi:hypothetical protein
MKIIKEAHIIKLKDPASLYPSLNENDSDGLEEEK